MQRQPQPDALFAEMEAPLGPEIGRTALGPEAAEELRTVSRLWFACGYRPGVGAYLNFFLLGDFIRLHDQRFPRRFASFKSMADSFYGTDLFIRAVTDSGREPTGGISSLAVRQRLAGIMARHAAISIPLWMMTYFGWSLVENVEKQCPPASEDERRWHLAYMAKTYRIMGVPFAEDRELMTSFGRSVEAHHAAATPQLETHARHILRLGEMIGVPSGRASIHPMLPDATRAVYEGIEPRVRPGPLRRTALRILGRFLVPQAVGTPREAMLAPA